MSEYCLLLRKDLSQPPEPAQWPDEVTLVTLNAALLQPVHDLLVQGYAGGEGSVPPLQEWQDCLRHDAEYDPQLCFVVLLEGEVVAVAQAWTSAYLKDLVVHPRQQGRGLGGALLRHVFAVFRQRNEAWVDLKVMAHNQRALRLYQKHGMTLVQRLAL